MYFLCIVIPTMLSLPIDILLIKRWSLLSIRHPARVTLHSVVALFIRRLVRCAEGSNEIPPEFASRYAPRPNCALGARQNYKPRFAK